MNNKIAGCVVLFHPDNNVPDNISTYISGLDLLLLMDNSPEQHSVIKDQLPDSEKKIIYCPLEGNKGIAYALNKAAELALDKGCNWLLTMDQDSHFKPGEFEILAGAINEVQQLYMKPAIITPFQQVHARFPERSDSRFSELGSAMTSGNLLNLQAWLLAGPFEDKLFIDYVDHEYCLRLRKHGYSIIQVNEIRLVHSLGYFELRKFFGKTIGISNHNPLRRYYIQRNGLYTVFKYMFFDRKITWFILKGMITDFFRVLLFEKQKGKKIMAMIRGTRDAIRGKFGKIILL